MMSKVSKPKSQKRPPGSGRAPRRKAQQGPGTRKRARWDGGRGGGTGRAGPCPCMVGCRVKYRDMDRGGYRGRVGHRDRGRSIGRAGAQAGTEARARSGLRQG